MKHILFFLIFSCNLAALGQVRCSKSFQPFNKNTHVSKQDDTTNKTGLIDMVSPMYERGLNPSALSFETQFLTDNSSVGLLVSFRGEFAGAIRLINQGEYFECHIQIDEKFRNRKLGPIMYVLAAKIIHEKYNAPIRSNYAGTYLLTPNARTVWENFYQLGLARIESQTLQGKVRYEMIPSAVGRMVAANLWELYQQKNVPIIAEPRKYTDEETRQILEMYNRVLGGD